MSFGIKKSLKSRSGNHHQNNIRRKVFLSSFEDNQEDQKEEQEEYYNIIKKKGDSNRINSYIKITGNEDDNDSENDDDDQNKNILVSHQKRSRHQNILNVSSTKNNHHSIIKKSKNEFINLKSSKGERPPHSLLSDKEKEENIDDHFNKSSSSQTIKKKSLRANVDLSMLKSSSSTYYASQQENNKDTNSTSNEDNIYSEEGLRKLKAQQLSMNQLRIVDNDQDLNQQQDEEQNNYNSIMVLHNDQEDIMMVGGGEVGLAKTENSSTKIMDASEIQRIKKLREQNRQTKKVHFGEDIVMNEDHQDNDEYDHDEIDEQEFISLSSGSHLKKKMNKQQHLVKSESYIDQQTQSCNADQQHESRLMTEDQEIEGEEVFEDYEGTNIAFGGDAAQKATEKTRKQLIENFEQAIMMDAGDDFDESENEEIKEWETQQMKKALSSNPQGHEKPQFVNELLLSSDSHVNIPEAFLDIPLMTTLPNVNDILSSITSEMNSLEFETRNRERVHEQSAKDIEDSLEKCKFLENDIQECSKKSTFYRDLKTFINNFSELLDVKVPELESLESKLIALLKSRNKQKKENLIQDLTILFGGITFYVPSLEYPTIKKTVREGEEEEKVYSEEAVLKVMDEYEALFDDVADEFSQPRTIKLKLLEWNQLYPEEYEQTYAELSFPYIFDFFVRYEMFPFDFAKPYQSLERRSWHYELRDIPRSAHLEEEPHVLVQVVKSSVLKKFNRFIADGLVDFSSTLDVQNLVKLLGDLRDYIDLNSHEWKNTTQIIQAQIPLFFQSLLESLDQKKHSLRPWSLDTLQIQRMNEHSRKKLIQFAYQIINHLILMIRFLEFEFVQQQLVSILNWIVPILKQQPSPFISKPKHATESVYIKLKDDVEVLKSIVGKIPKTWLNDSILSCPTYLSSIELYVDSCLPLLDATSIVMDDSEKTQIREMLVQLCVDIHAYDRASRLNG